MRLEHKSHSVQEEDAEELKYVERFNFVEYYNF